MLNRALSKAKKEGGKKIPINFQVPGELKEQFENLCKKNEVSVTSMLTGLMETALEEAQGIYFELTPDSLLTINNRMVELEKFIREVEQHGAETAIEVEDRYESAKNELYRLNKIFNAYKK